MIIHKNPKIANAHIPNKIINIIDGAKVFLGTAELGAVTANMGKLPTQTEYLEAYKSKIEPKKDKVYRYLQFDELKEYQPASGKKMRVVA